MTGVYVTVEEAVARVMKFDDVLGGVDVFATLTAFLEDAVSEYEYEEALQDPSLVDEEYKLRVAICLSRCKLAEYLQKQLTKDPLLKFDSENKIELDSVAYWAAVTYGIEINGSIEETPSEAVTWADVTIKIYKSYSIRYYFGKEKQKLSHFRAIDLMGERQNNPNKQGGILIGLSMNKKFPNAVGLSGADKKAMTDLRKSLRKLTGLSGNPFLSYNKADGYKAKFKLQDCRRISDERAKAKAQYESYSDGNGYVLRSDLHRS